MTLTVEGGRETDLELVRVAMGGGRGENQKLIAQAFLRSAALCLRKNADYGSSFALTSDLAPEIKAADAVLVRMGDKIRRFAQLRAQDPEVAAESAVDTMRDLGNYAVLWCLLQSQEWKDLAP